MNQVNNIETLLPIILKGLKISKDQGIKEYEEFKKSLLDSALPVFEGSQNLATQYVDIITNESLSLKQVGEQLLKLKV